MSDISEKLEGISRELCVNFGRILTNKVTEEVPVGYAMSFVIETVSAFSIGAVISFTREKNKKNAEKIKKALLENIAEKYDEVLSHMDEIEKEIQRKRDENDR